MNVTTDVNEFLDKFGLTKSIVAELHPEIEVRLDHLEEEFNELITAVDANDLEEVVDALVDLVYIAVGTASLCGFDFDAHWNEVHRVNMNKERGVTKRGTEFDVRKPKGWTGPDHKSIINKGE